MATALETADPIRSPLDRLGGQIRRYVLTEALLAAGFFLAGWFWLGLALDFGAFKLFGLDWVQLLPLRLRAALLVGTVGALVMLLSARLMKLRRELRPAALALVLERRFPEQLGDRLITAVELADLTRAEGQGYSRAMIAETIREASERVGTLSLDTVLDWPRLRRQGRWLLAVTLGLFVVVGLVGQLAIGGGPMVFADQFGEVSRTWAERNLLLRNLIWPRKAFLQLIDFPESGELKVGRDAPAPRIRVMAFSWIVADANALDGWRGMRYRDLNVRTLGSEPPPLPWALIADDVSPDLSLDRLERLLGQASVQAKLRDAMTGDDYLATQQLFETLGQRAALSGSRRVFRRLDVPERVEVSLWGAKTASRIEMNRGSDGEFSASLSDLRESVEFIARGLDYRTPTQRITIVPPPQLVELVRDEFHPAYLYHRAPLGRAPDGGLAGIKGLKQEFRGQRTSLNGPLSRVIVPAGSAITFRASSDKALESASVRPRGAGESFPTPTLAADGRGFTVTLPPLVKALDTDLVFTDTDGVQAARHVVVELIADPAPKVSVLLDGIRKTPQGYMVTPVAMLPVAGTVSDRSEQFNLGGLDAVEYSITVQRLESTGAAVAQASWVASALMIPTPFSPAPALLAAGTVVPLNQALTASSNPVAEHAFPVDGFAQLLRERATSDVLKAQLLQNLSKPPVAPSPLLTQFELKPQFEFLDLRERLPDLKVKDTQAFQPRYRLRLTVRATDNNADTGPGISINEEPPFTIVVVSDAELLVEVARDEETQHLKLEDVVNRLRDARLRLEKVAEQVATLPPDQLATMALRALEVQDTVTKGRDATGEVLSDYRRILRELQLNRLQPDLIAKVDGEIRGPLERVLDAEFPQAESGTEAYRTDLDAARRPAPEKTRDTLSRIDRLIARLEAIMAAMGDLTTANKLITMLREIEKSQDQDIRPALDRLRELQRQKLIQKIDGKLD